MALNLDAVRKAQEKLEKGGGDIDFYQPKEGQNIVRILPPVGDNELCWKEFDTHFNVGPEKKMVICLKTFGKRCPICEYLASIKNSANPEDKQAHSDMRAVHRVYMNVLDMKAKDGIVKVYGCGNSVLKQVVNSICIPGFGDITDMTQGNDVYITKKGSGRNTEYAVAVSPTKTAVAGETNESIQAKLHDLDELVPEKSYEEAKAILLGEEVVATSTSSNSADEVVTGQGVANPASSSLKDEIKNALK